MSRNLAYRPHYHFRRAVPCPLRQPREEFARWRWRYRRRSDVSPHHPPGYTLALVPYGWKLTLPEIRLRAR